ncbi:hypothetical protein GCM10010387_51950 [Streptomyces inusitatus]|uniref:2Fe-2S ferredoxin-type domain-containing protein n=1 Tax=Streptomyces inusitatus TaxID=68221 RepID=A0A918QIR5_9ACTN|nr:(2Fe-2S)-binding protein [Streptomyces inusitatus]GGZ51182.1 hypothetical protein GCM10010387_51950 [Streptomyces inusitatus]
MSPEPERPPRPARVSRRGFIGRTTAASLGAGALPRPDQATAAAAAAAAAGAPGQPLPGPPGTEVTLRVNGAEHRVGVDNRATLLDTLRERLRITGPKKGCDRGQCGACTVHIDGRTALSCLTLAVAAHEREVTTVEGLADGDVPHPVQRAFIKADAFQCGFCTPGQIMSAVALVEHGPVGSDDAIREFMSGNLCRCAAYPHIVRAVRQAGSTGRKR